MAIFTTRDKTDIYYKLGIWPADVFSHGILQFSSAKDIVTRKTARVSIKGGCNHFATLFVMIEDPGR